jgi:pilus assembly protein Flp/PilA
MFDPIIRFFLNTMFDAKQGARKIRDQEGATAVEYGLMVALIAGAIIIAVTLVGTNLSKLFSDLAAKLNFP